MGLLIDEHVPRMGAGLVTGIYAVVAGLPIALIVLVPLLLITAGIRRWRVPQQR